MSTPELIFDLVFVFAFIQVTALMANNFTGRGVVRGVLVLAVLWSAWSVSAWLSTRVRADFGVVRVGFLTVMAMLFLLAVTAPEAYTDLPGGLNGPAVFAVCYLIVRSLLLALTWYSLPVTRGLPPAVLGVPMLGAGLILAAAFVPQWIFNHPEQVSLAQIGLWLLAVLIDYLVGIGLPLPQRRIFSAAHWAERHSLIIIIALGESVISVGLAGSRLPASWPLVLSALFGVALAGALAWIYFDVVALAGEQSLQHCPLEHRPRLARDAYTYLHLPMIVGIIILALGLKKELGYGSPESYRPETAVPGVTLYALYGGVVLFLLAQVGFQLRVTRLVTTIIWPRLAAAGLLIGLIPVVSRLPALTVLAILTAVCLTTILVEVVVADGQRRRLREAALLGD